jgi:uracil phosphoribosyltransferase
MGHSNASRWAGRGTKLSYDARVPVTVLDHPLAQHLLAALRARSTAPPLFRTLTKRLTFALALEASTTLPTRSVQVDTPLERTTGRVLASDLVAVPVLRAGLGMLEAVTELFPEILVGYIGLERDETTLEPGSYYEKLPDVRGRHVLILDPMLATGGSGAWACRSVKEAGPESVRFLSVVAAPQGVSRLERDHPDVQIFTAALDRDLDEHGFILPGLGDFGDRLFGTP